MGFKRKDSSAPLEPLVVTIDEAKTLLKCGTTTVYELMNSGKLERRKIGSLTRITYASIKRAVAETA